MKKTVGCFTEEKLKELSSQPNTMVMQPTHDVIFEPWSAQKVSDIMDRVVKITKENENIDSESIKSICMKDKDISDFSEKYQVMFGKLIDPLFVKDTENLRVIKKMIMLKFSMDQGKTSSQQAQAEASDLALKSLSSRVKNSK